MKSERRPPESGLDIGSHEIRIISRAEGNDPGRCPRCHRPHSRIVIIENGTTALRQRFDQVSFLLGDILQRTKELQVRPVHARHDANLRPGQLAQVTNLVEVITSQLQHGPLML